MTCKREQWDMRDWLGTLGLCLFFPPIGFAAIARWALGTQSLAMSTTRERRAGMVLCLLAAVGAGLAGLLTMSEATTGDVLMAGACLLAILARIVQASHQHKDLLRVRDRG